MRVDICTGRGGVCSTVPTYCTPSSTGRSYPHFQKDDVRRKGSSLVGTMKIGTLSIVFLLTDITDSRTEYCGTLSYYIQHSFICRPSDSIVPTDAGIEPRTVAPGALAVRRLTTRLNLIRVVLC